MHTLLKRTRGILALGILFLTAAWLLPPSPAEQPGGVFSAVFEAEPSPAASPQSESGPAAASESVLLLRNGEMLRGRVIRHADRYEVQVSGGEIYIRVADVQYECRDVHDAYQRKKSLIRNDNAQDHLDLAHWCIKAGILDCASQELAAATALDPHHPLIPVRKRQLDVASAPPSKPTGRKSMAAGPTPQELDRMVRGMPPKTVETFSQVIQPMLVNNCSAAACHGQTVQNGFRLLRVPTDSPPSRLLTQRNLHAALQWLDRDHPDDSPLLTFATQAHGAARVAIFTDRQVLQFRQLRDWCNRVCAADSAVMQASFHEPAGSGTGRGNSRGATGSSRPAKRHRAAQDGAAQDATVPAWDRNTIDLRTTAGTDGQQRTHRRPNGSQKSPAAEPNNPETFNRQFSSGDRPAGSAKASPSSPSRTSQGPAAKGDESSPADASSSSRGASADE